MRSEVRAASFSSYQTRLLSTGRVVFSWDVMRHEGRPYYAGLLKAAELDGATHQAVMEFQIVTYKRLREIRAGRSAIAFYYRKDMASVGGGIEDRKTDTGRTKISSVELTVLHLVHYPHAAGGIDNLAVQSFAATRRRCRGGNSNDHKVRDSDLSPEPKERNERWHVIVRRLPERHE